MELRKDVLAGRAAFEFDLFGDDLDRNVAKVSEIMEWADRMAVSVRYAISEGGVDEDETPEIVMNVLREQLAEMRKAGFYG